MAAGSSSEMVTPHDKDEEANILPSSVISVLSDYDLMFEILLRLPVLSLLFFKSVSKQWLNIITSPRFVKLRGKIPKLDPPFAILTRGNNWKKVQCNFESLDTRIPSKKCIRFSIRSPAGVWIRQSCNGLLLCTADNSFCVHNPTINQFRMLPIPKNSSLDGARMAFDPAKSPHYKIIQSVTGHAFITKLRMYFSETNTSTLYDDTFSAISFQGFNTGVYWNGAIHWLNCKIVHFKLDIACEKLVLTELELPVTLDLNSDFQTKLFESRGCLLLVGKDCAHPLQMNVYEMRHGYTEWSVKYIITVDDIFMSLGIPRPSLGDNVVCCIVLGEREEDSFMIIQSLGNVVQYNPVLKTVHQLHDLEFHDLDSPGLSFMRTFFDGVQLIASFSEP